MSVAIADRFEIELEGKTHQASYIVWEDNVTVTYKGKKKSTQVGNFTADLVAKLLLSEMVHDKRPKR